MTAINNDGKEQSIKSKAIIFKFVRNESDDAFIIKIKDREYNDHNGNDANEMAQDTPLFPRNIRNVL